EMTSRPRPAPMPASRFSLVRWERPLAEKYRALFMRVGAPWLWFSRLALSSDELEAIIHDPDVAIWAVCDRAGVEIGLLELDFREAGQCEIAFFGVVPELMGKGLGTWMMAHALGAAWRTGVSRVWLHSCTFDAPQALGFYRRRGFTPFAQAIETFPDPRLNGLLPRDAAPHIPLLSVTN
ncbi:MAG: hypothetical protein RIQ68_329, partial [Pseudomonadota bacterium]